MKFLIKQHWAAIVLALAFGLLSAGPFILFASLSPSSEMVVYPELTNDQDFYLSRIQEVRDGFGGGNSFLYEYKDVPAVQPRFGEYTMALLLDLGNLHTGSSVVLGPLVFLPLLFLITVGIFNLLGLSRFWSLFLSSTFFFGLYFFVFARPISPQFNFIFWLLAALSLFVLIKDASWRIVFCAALSYGALFYIYPYYWTHFTVVYGLLFLVYLYLDRKVGLRIFAAGLGGVIVGSGYFITLFEARSLPIYQETLERLGLTYTHFPSGGMTAVLVVIFIFISVYIILRQRSATPEVLTSLALVVGGMIAMNQHLITGMSLEFSSHYTMQIVVSCFFLAVSLWKAFGSAVAVLRNPVVRAVAFVVLILIFLPKISEPFEAALAAAQNPAHSARAEVVRWIGHNIPEKSVLYAPDMLAKLIPAYTSNDVFFGRAASFYFMSNEEVRQRSLIHYFNAPHTYEVIISHQREFFGQLLINPRQHAQRKSQLIGWLYPVEVPAELPKNYFDVLQAQKIALEDKTFSEVLSPYRVDYIVIEPHDPFPLTERDLSLFKLIATIQGYSVYERTR